MSQHYSGMAVELPVHYSSIHVYSAPRHLEPSKPAFIFTNITFIEMFSAATGHDGAAGAGSVVGAHIRAGRTGRGGPEPRAVRLAAPLCQRGRGGNAPGLGLHAPLHQPGGDQAPTPILGPHSCRMQDFGLGCQPSPIFTRSGAITRSTRHASCLVSTRLFWVHGRSVPPSLLVDA